MAKSSGEKLIANNKKAYHDYFILDKYETAKKIADEIKELDTNTSKIECPSDEEIRWLKQAQNKILRR